MDFYVNELIFKYKKPDFEKLGHYGFLKQGDTYQYTTLIMDGQMELTVSISSTGIVDTKVMDLNMGEEYALYRVAGASGSFVGKVREECEEILKKIAASCFYRDIFKSTQAKEIMEYVKRTYGDELEYLWKKFPENAVLRRKDNRKWYAALLTIPRDKLGMDSQEKIEILDIRMLPEDIETVVDGKRYHPGYHMNKKNWITICLDNTVPTQEILKLIDQSYQIAAKK